MSPRAGERRGCHRQRGMALVVVMVFTMLLALSGLAGMSLAVQEERMAGNFHRQAEALLAAEAGLASVLDWLDGAHETLECAPETPLPGPGWTGFGEGAVYGVVIDDCDEDGRMLVRSTGYATAKAAKRVIEAAWAPPEGPLPARFESWREILE